MTVTYRPANVARNDPQAAQREANRTQWEQNRRLKRGPASERTGTRSLAGFANPDFTTREANETTSYASHMIGAGEIATETGGTPGEFSSADQYRDDMSKSGKDGTGKSLSDKQSDNITHAGTAFASFGLVVSAANAVNVFMEGGDTQERFEAILSAGTSAASMASAIGASVKAKEGGDNASPMTKMADGVMAEIASTASAMKEAWDLAVKIAEAIKAKGDVDSDMETSAKATATVEIVKSLLLTGKGAIDTVNSFMGHLGSVSTGLVQAAPAIGIAINACEMIINGFSIAESYISMVEMRQQKRYDKEKVLGRAAAKSKGIRGFFGGHESAAGQAKSDIDALQNKVNPDSTEKTILRNAQDYMLNKNLQEIAQKRINRGILNIIQNSVAIAGDIAILSGAGAMVGAGLKAGSAGIGIAAAALRIGKQWYHNYNGDTDPKSEKNKLKRYDEMITMMVRNINEANTAVPAGLSPEETQAETKALAAKQEIAVRQVYASGMTPAKMKAYLPRADAAHAADPTLTGTAEKTAGKALYTDWIAALKKR